VIRKTNILIVSLTFLTFSNIFAQEAILSTTCNPSLTTPIREKAFELMKSREYDEAALLFRKIAVMCPDNAVAQMDFGSTLFASASKYFDRNREPMFQKEALPVLEEAAVYLKKAISLFGSDEGSIFFKSHAYYLLGDIYHYGLVDLKEAEKFYQTSLSFIPDNSVVKKELLNIQDKK
jgi:tetratricopeptide (TPR) repeat protein